MKPSIRGGDKSKQTNETRQQVEEGTVKARVQTESYLASVLVPRAASTRDITVLEPAWQGLPLADRNPVEWDRAETASSRQFLLRATSAMTQRHLADQVQARYPQAIIRLLIQEGDPLSLREGETVSVVELRAGAEAYLPLRILRERELLQEGADPLLGILGMFNHLPPHMRVVTQLALIPVSPTWSQPYRRKSVEHPLEQERLRARREGSGAQANAPGTLQLIGMGVLVALALGGMVVLGALFCLAFVVLQIRSRMAVTSIYDMRLVEEKTARPAYRVRLRLFVFSSQAGGRLDPQCFPPARALAQPNPP